MIDIPLTDDFLIGAAAAADGSLERTERGVRPHRLPSWLRERWPEPQLMAIRRSRRGRGGFTTAARSARARTPPT